MSKINFMLTEYVDNITQNVTTHQPGVSGTIFTVMIIHSIIASVGIIGNFTVIIVLVNHRKFRKKIPNIFIINQVSR